MDETVEILTETIDELEDKLGYLRRRVKELEDGACRHNCITKKEAFLAGYDHGFSEGFHCEENPGMPLDAEVEYKQWKELDK